MAATHRRVVTTAVLALLAACAHAPPAPVRDFHGRGVVRSSTGRIVYLDADVVELPRGQRFRRISSAEWERGDGVRVRVTGDRIETDAGALVLRASDMVWTIQGTGALGRKQAWTLWRVARPLPAEGGLLVVAYGRGEGPRTLPGPQAPRRTLQPQDGSAPMETRPDGPSAAAHLASTPPRPLTHFQVHLDPAQELSELPWPQLGLALLLTL